MTDLRGKAVVFAFNFVFMGSPTRPCGLQAKFRNHLRSGTKRVRPEAAGFNGNIIAFLAAELQNNSAVRASERCQGGEVVVEGFPSLPVQF